MPETPYTGARNKGECAERKCIHMNRFLPREKMGKREKRALDRAKRNTWEGINPVTRTIENKKIYN